MNSAANLLAAVAPDATVRGDGEARFVFASGNDRSIELSATDDGFWVEYWRGTIESPDHNCLFHTYEAATTDAIDWLTHKTTIDQVLPCAQCDGQSTLRDWLDNTKRSLPANRWLVVVCPDCGANNHLSLQSLTLSMGILDGFPAPTFVPKCTLNISTMSFSTHEDGIRIQYQSLSWFFPSTS